MAITPRTTSPDVSIKYYRHTGYLYDDVDGVNVCLLIDSTTGEVMPNCVGYTWGRWYEAYNERPNLFTGDAVEWWGYNDGYIHNQQVGTGKVACFQGGSYNGHVAFVEIKESDTVYVTSNSYYNSTYFTLERIKYEGGTWVRHRYSDDVVIGGYTFQGFIGKEPTHTGRKLPLIYYSKLL